MRIHLSSATPTLPLIETHQSSQSESTFFPSSWEALPLPATRLASASRPASTPDLLIRAPDLPPGSTAPEKVVPGWNNNPSSGAAVFLSHRHPTASVPTLVPEPQAPRHRYSYPPVELDANLL